MPGRSRSQLRKQQKMQEDWVEPDWRIYEVCFSCDSKFVVNNYDDRKPRPERHRFQGKLICPWCWRRGGRKLAQAAFLLEKLIKLTPDYGELWFDDNMATTVKIATKAEEVMVTWG